MRSFFHYFLTALLIGGCTGQLEQQTEATKAQVEKTNDQLFELKNLQTLGAALEIMTDKDKSPNARARAAEIVFVKADEKSLADWMGTVLPLRTPSITETIPNVTMVTQDDKATILKLGELSVAPVDEELHSILSFASQRFVTRLRKRVEQPLTAEELGEMRDYFVKAALISTAVVPALIIDSKEGPKPVEMVPATKEVRENLAKKLMELYSALKPEGKGFSEAELKTLIQIRLGIKP